MSLNSLRALIVVIHFLFKCRLLLVVLVAGISVVLLGLPDGAHRRRGGEVVVIVIVPNVGP